MTAIRLLGDRVLVALPPKETESDPETGYTVQPKGVSAGGIILAAPTDRFDVEIATRGIVMQLGQKRDQVEREAAEGILYGLRNRAITIETAIRMIETIDGAEFDVAVGDYVLFSPSAGDQFALAGINYVILREAEILGVVAAISEAA